MMFLRPTVSGRWPMIKPTKELALPPWTDVPVKGAPLVDGIGFDDVWDKAVPTRGADDPDPHPLVVVSQDFAMCLF